MKRIICIMIGLMICVVLSMTDKDDMCGIGYPVVDSVNENTVITEVSVKDNPVVNEVDIEKDKEDKINARLKSLNDIIGNENTGIEERKNAVRESIEIIETLPEEEQIGKLIALAISKKGY